MKRMLTYVFLALVISGASRLEAAVIVGYNIPQTGSGYTSIAPHSTPPEITASPLTINGALSGPAFGNHFYFSGWNNTFNPTKYYQNTITVAPGYLLTLDDVSYSVEDTGGGGQSTFQVRSSLDGFTSIIDAFTVTNTSGLVVNRTSDLSGLGPISGSVIFRFYATTPNSSIAMGFANHLPGGDGGGLSDVGQNIRFNGAVNLVPEPSTLVLGTLGLIGLLRWKKIRK